MFYLTTHSTHFIYGYMASDIWLRTILIVRKETCCRHIGYSYRLTARVLLYAPSHRQDNTYHGLCYTSRGALAGTRNSSMGSFSKTDHSISITTHTKCLLLFGLKLRYSKLYKHLVGTSLVGYFPILHLWFLSGIKHMVKNHSDNDRETTALTRLGFAFTTSCTPVKSA